MLATAGALLPFTAPSAGAVSTTSSPNCNNQDGVNYSTPATSVPSGPISLSSPMGETSADDEAQTMGARVSVSSSSPYDNNAECEMIAEVSTTLAILPGSSGLAIGTPVRIVLDLDLDGNLSAGVPNPGSSGNWENAWAKADEWTSYEIWRGSTRLAAFGASFRQEQNTGAGSPLVLPSWSSQSTESVWSLSNVQDLAEHYSRPWQSCRSDGTCDGPGDPGPRTRLDTNYAAFSTLEFEAAIGDTLVIDGTLGASGFTAGQADAQVDFSYSEAPKGFSASYAPGPGFEGIGLTVGQADPAAPTLSVGDVTHAEGDSGTTTFSFPVTLSAPSSQTVTVHAATDAGGTATAGSDYAALGDTLVSFAPGDTSETVDVAVTGDLGHEADETFTVSLSSPTNATVADGQATGTITNDDALPTVSVGDVTQAEGDSGTTTFSFTVGLSPAGPDPVSVTYATADGSASAGPDYAAVAPTVLTFAPGEVSRAVTVAVSGDTVAEADETFFVQLTNPVGATVGTSTATGTILDDDATGLSPSMFLQVHSLGHGPGPHYLGDSVHPRVALSRPLGAPTGPLPTGTVTARWFDGKSCKGRPDATSDPVPLSSNGTADMAAFSQTPTSAGTYSFQVSYPGDGLFVPVTGCVNVEIVQAGLHMTVQLHDASHDLLAGSMALGGSVHPVVWLTGDVWVPSGTFTARYYANGRCKGRTSTTSSAQLVSGAVDMFGFSQTPTTEGTVSFRLYYSGDSFYPATTSACTPIEVTP